jgi:hypothetical protein
MNPRSFFVALAFMAAGSLFAAEPVATSGVTLSLATNGSTFDTPPPVAVPVSGTGVVRKTAVVPPASFTASILLWNRSAADLSFMFPSAVSAERHFVFRVYDAANVLVWQSSVPTPVTVATTAVGTDPPGAVVQGALRRHAIWRATQAIPLIIDGKPLPVGAYALEGSIDGTPVFSSRVSFQVLGSTIVDPMTSGIKGRVFAGPISPVARIGEPNERPVAHAIIQYFNAIAANAVVTTVIANDEGRFQFSVPPGQYVVMATIPGDENTPFGHGTQTVTVKPDQATEIVFHLDTGIR